MGDVASFVAFRKISKATLLKKVDFSVMALSNAEHPKGTRIRNAE